MLNTASDRVGGSHASWLARSYTIPDDACMHAMRCPRVPIVTVRNRTTIGSIVVRRPSSDASSTSLLSMTQLSPHDVRAAPEERCLVNGSKVVSRQHPQPTPNQVPGGRSVRRQRCLIDGTRVPGRTPANAARHAKRAGGYVSAAQRQGHGPGARVPFIGNGMLYATTFLPSCG